MNAKELETQHNLKKWAATFVELLVTKESPASTELTVAHTICENKMMAVFLKIVQ